jgi:hypothetical protein
MSEVQTGITTVTREVSVEDLRRAEEERRAAELADRMRREEEARQRALANARNATAQVHTELSSMQQQLNEAKSRLPDLTFCFDSLPEMPRSGEVSEWQHHAATVSSLVNDWRNELEHAIRVAEEILRRRVRTQKAWQENSQLLAAHRANVEQLEALNQFLPDVRHNVEYGLSVLEHDATYEEIESFNESLAMTIERLGLEIRRFTNIGLNNDLLATQVRAITTPFEMVMGADRTEAWKEYKRTEALSAFEAAFESRLATARWSEDNLPQDLALSLARIRSGIAKAENTDFFGRLLQAAERKARMEAAQSMLNTAPSYIPPELTEEWRFIAVELEKVAFGHNALTTNLTRRYQSIHEASKLALTHAYVFAQAKAAIAECGLIIEEDVIDLVFDGNEAPPSVMAFTVPGFLDRKVVLSMDSTGNTASLPLRFNDSDAESERLRDIEFDHEVCHSLSKALSSLASSGIAMALTKEETDHPVLRASALGIRLRRSTDADTAKKHFAREA